MPFVRVEKRTSPFVVLDKSCLNDTRLKWRSKGLHAYLLSLPDNWKINMTDLTNRAIDGREGLRAAMHDLIRAGYVRRNRTRNEDGTMGGWEYVVYEVPKPTQEQLTLISENEDVKTEPTTRERLNLRKYFAAWASGTGGKLIPASWFITGIRELEETHGENVVFDAFMRYAKSEKSRYGTKPFFENFGEWSRKQETKIVDQYGD